MENLPANEINLSANEVKLHTEIYGLKREVIHLRAENEALKRWIIAIADLPATPDWIQQSARSLLASQAAKG